MPLETQHYGIEAFTWGDFYSASIDKRRFNIIDNQLAFVSDIIGEGIINGWSLSINDIGNREIKISSGMGIIGRKVLKSLGDFTVQIENGQTQYIYMKKKVEDYGGTSGFSNLSSVTASDSVAPNAPSNLTTLGVEDLIKYNQIAFTWDSNTEIDFSHYLIKRTTDEYLSFKEIASTKNTQYIDLELDADTIYEYQVVAVDLSGNESDASEISISTKVDNRIPSPPLFLQTFPLDGGAQIIWDSSPSDYVDRYLIEVKEYEGDTVLQNIYIDTGINNYTINNLDNSTTYQISIYAVSQFNFLSESLTKRVTPENKEGAGEVKDISVEFQESTYENIDIEANLSWDYVTNEYLPDIDYFKIIFIENGVRFSEPINVKSIDADNYNYNIKLLPFVNSDNEIVYESFKEYTPYLMIIYTVSVDGDISNGIFYRINRTPTYDLLSSISENSISREANNDLLITWVNPNSEYFSYNKITITVTDLSESVDEIYVEDYNIGKTDRFTIPNSYFGIDKRFNISIVPVDIFGREGQIKTFSKQYTKESYSVKPKSPRRISANSEDNTVVVRWSRGNKKRDIKSYKIYRAEGLKFYYSVSDFTLIKDDYPSNKTKFVDYDVESGQTYSYLVTAVNIYDEESNNPSDGFVPPGNTIITAQDSNLLPAPENLSVSSSGKDAILTWDATSGAFDGYEIYRSIGNSYSFIKIGQTYASDTTYTDENILLTNDEDYYYLVKKYRNETNVYVTSSTIPPSDSVLLGTAYGYLEGGSQKIDIDTSNAFNLQNLEDIIKDIVKEKIDEHNHALTLSADKRIELRANSVVTNWDTNDYQVYSTNEDIEGASSYILKIDGTINESFFETNGVIDYGALKLAQSKLSPVNYEIDEDSGAITFSEPLYKIDCVEKINPLTGEKECELGPYLDEPEIILELINISEVKSSLENDKVENIDASQITSGTVRKEQMPQVQHDGRVGERLIPLLLPTSTLDNYTYGLRDKYIEDDRNKFGNSIAFYDIKQIDNDRLLAATSRGVMYSSNYGNDWEKQFSFETPCHKIFITSDNRLFSMTTNSMYKGSLESLSSWQKMDGLEAVKIIRDITEDNLGNIYISTDLGVYKLNKDKPYIEDTWEQLPIFGPRSSNAYAIIYIEQESRLLTSNELGILESINNGDTWTYIPEIPNSTKIFEFKLNNGYIFALSEESIYRKKIGDSEFISIATYNSQKARELIIFNDNLYLVSENGAKVSNVEDIYLNNDINFVTIWSKINVQEKLPIFSVNVIDDNIFIGCENKLFLMDLDNDLWMQYEEKDNITPTIYLDGQIQNIGYYYNNGGTYHNVVFDDKLDYDSVVEVANKYDIYVAANGGWVSQNYNSSFKIWKNKMLYAESPSEFSVDKSIFENVTFPNFNDSNSNYVTALEKKVLFEDSLESLNNSELDGDDLAPLVTDCFNKYNEFNSQLYIDARYVESISDSAGVTSLPFVFPGININIVNKYSTLNSFGEVVQSEVETGDVVNVVNGKFTFDKEFKKEDEVLIDIYGCTLLNSGDNSHREIEDNFELINSGLPSYLSQVRDANVGKLALFIKQTWGDTKTLEGRQMETTLPLMSNFDSLNSTFNYEMQNDFSDDIIRLFCPYDILYINEIESILIVGENGALLLDMNNLEISNIDIVFENEIPKYLYRDNNIIYLLTNKNVYKSIDFCISWDLEDKSGLPNKLGSIDSINNNLVVGAEDGIYYRPSNNVSWEKALSSDILVEYIYSPDLMFVAAGNDVYYSGNGYNFNKMEINLDSKIIKIVKINSTIYLQTASGIYSDNGSFYGENPYVAELEISEQPININDIYVHNNKLYIACSNGDYYELNDDGIRLYEYSSLSTIHKICVTGEDSIWLFAFNQVKNTLFNYPIILTNGVPL